MSCVCSYFRITFGTYSGKLISPFLLEFKMEFRSASLLFIFATCSIFQDGSSSNILFLFPLGFKSYTHVFQPLVQALAARGHNLTVVTPVSSSTPLPSNVHEIAPIGLDPLIETFGNIFEVRKMGRLAFSARFDLDLFLSLYKQGYADPQFQEVISKSYDLIIMNGFMNEGFLGVISRIGAPFILLTTMPTPAYLTQYTGNYLPPSFVPLPFWDLPDRMTFTQRLLNYVMNGVFEFLATYVYRGKYENAYRDVLGEHTSSMEEIYKNVSLIFMNSHFSLNYPRPNIPDNIEVGGMHCRPPKPLPKDLDSFLSEAEHGFIYFSLGSIIRTNQMPDEYRQIFVNVFSRLKQRVLWKWETEEMPNLPANIKLAKWLPQQDVLGHSNIRVFMTHGGLLSTQEAAYHGVPILGIPIFADQDLNMRQSESQGFALTLEILNMTESVLEGKLRQLLDEPRFTERAKGLSKIVRDQTQTPLERAVYWSEYVIRHKGATHMRSAGRDLNYFQVHSYDVVGFLVLIFSLVLLLLKLCLGCLFRCCSRKDSLQQMKPNSKKAKVKRN